MLRWVNNFDDDDDGSRNNGGGGGDDGGCGGKDNASLDSVNGYFYNFCNDRTASADGVGAGR